MSDLPQLTKAEIVVVAESNDFRRADGVAPLERNPALDQAARLFAQYLAKSGRFGHEADGRTPSARVQEAGYEHCAVAENLASATVRQATTIEGLAKTATEGWKESPAHRRNLLLAHMTDVGVGVARAPGAEAKYVIVQVLARPKRFAFTFSIANKSPETVTYEFAGKTHQIASSETATHEACDPDKLTFKAAGNWLSGTRIGTEYTPMDGMSFVLRHGSDARVRVEVRN